MKTRTFLAVIACLGSGFALAAPPANESQARIEQLTQKLEESSASEPVAPEFEFREWTTVFGGYKTTAKMLGTDNVMVTLQKPNGNVGEVEKKRLAGRHRVYVEVGYKKITEYVGKHAAWKDRHDKLASELEIARDDERARELAQADSAVEPARTAPPLPRVRRVSQNKPLAEAGTIIASCIGLIAILMTIMYFRPTRRGEGINHSNRGSRSVRQRRRFGPKVRRRIWDRCRRRCYYCNGSLPSWRGAHMHLDHLKPFARGGADDESNLVASCPACNAEKHAAEFPELYG